MARPTKFTTTTKRRLYKALRLGATRTHSAVYAGISYELFRQWMRKGEDGQAPFVGFVVAVKRAEAEACMRALENISRAGEKTWQASAWWLERRYPQEWGRQQRVEVTEIHAPTIVGTFSDPWEETDDDEDEQEFEV